MESEEKATAMIQYYNSYNSTPTIRFVNYCYMAVVILRLLVPSHRPENFMCWCNTLHRARNCDQLVANATKNWVLATRISELVASRRLGFSLLNFFFTSKENQFRIPHQSKVPDNRSGKTQFWFFDHHVYWAPYCFSGFSQQRYCRRTLRTLENLPGSRNQCYSR